MLTLRNQIRIKRNDLIGKAKKKISQCEIDTSLEHQLHAPEHFYKFSDSDDSHFIDVYIASKGHLIRIYGVERSITCTDFLLHICSIYDIKLSDQVLLVRNRCTFHSNRMSWKVAPPSSLLFDWIIPLEDNVEYQSDLSSGIPLYPVRVEYKSSVRDFTIPALSKQKHLRPGLPELHSSNNSSAQTVKVKLPNGLPFSLNFPYSRPVFEAVILVCRVNNLNPSDYHLRHPDTRLTLDPFKSFVVQRITSFELKACTSDHSNLTYLVSQTDPPDGNVDYRHLTRSQRQTPGLPVKYLKRHSVASIGNGFNDTAGSNSTGSVSVRRTIAGSSNRPPPPQLQALKRHTTFESSTTTRRSLFLSAPSFDSFDGAVVVGRKKRPAPPPPLPLSIVSPVIEQLPSMHGRPRSATLDQSTIGGNRRSLARASTLTSSTHRRSHPSELTSSTRRSYADYSRVNSAINQKPMPSLRSPLAISTRMVGAGVSSTSPTGSDLTPVPQSPQPMQRRLGHNDRQRRDSCMTKPHKLSVGTGSDSTSPVLQRSSRISASDSLDQRRNSYKSTNSMHSVASNGSVLSPVRPPLPQIQRSSRIRNNGGSTNGSVDSRRHESYRSTTSRFSVDAGLDRSPDHEQPQRSSRMSTGSDFDARRKRASYESSTSRVSNVTSRGSTPVIQSSSQRYTPVMDGRDSVSNSTQCNSRQSISDRNSFIANESDLSLPATPSPQRFGRVSKGGSNGSSRRRHESYKLEKANEVLEGSNLTSFSQRPSRISRDSSTGGSVELQRCDSSTRSLLDDGDSCLTPVLQLSAQRSSRNSNNVNGSLDRRKAATNEVPSPNLSPLPRRPNSHIGNDSVHDDEADVKNRPFSSLYASWSRFVGHRRRRRRRDSHKSTTTNRDLVVNDQGQISNPLGDRPSLAIESGNSEVLDDPSVHIALQKLDESLSPHIGESSDSPDEGNATAETTPSPSSLTEPAIHVHDSLPSLETSKSRSLQLPSANELRVGFWMRRRRRRPMYRRNIFSPTHWFNSLTIGDAPSSVNAAEQVDESIDVNSSSDNDFQKGETIKKRPDSNLRRNSTELDETSGSVVEEPAEMEASTSV